MGTSMQGSILRIALITAGVLLVPLVAMQFSDGVDWQPGDFLVAGVLIFGTGLAYQLISSAVGKQYRVAIGLALGAAFAWIWVELAVGLFTNWGS